MSYKFLNVTSTSDYALQVSNFIQQNPGLAVVEMLPMEDENGEITFAPVTLE